MNWSSNWPTERGYYWFYGHSCYNSGRVPPALGIVQVHHDGNGNPVYILNGSFLYKANGAEGQFCHLEPPALPALGASGA